MPKANDEDVSFEKRLQKKLSGKDIKWGLGIQRGGECWESPMLCSVLVMAVNYDGHFSLIVSKVPSLSPHRKEQEALKQRLQGLERKILVGGENLLEKAEEQERLLEESAKELEERRRHEEQLRRAITQKEAERIDLEERYTSLQEEAAGKTRKLKKVWTLLMAAKSELGDMQAEHQREMEALLESVRHLSREHKLHQLIIDSFIPLDYQVRASKSSVFMNAITLFFNN